MSPMTSKTAEDVPKKFVENSRKKNSMEVETDCHEGATPGVRITEAWAPKTGQKKAQKKYSENLLKTNSIEIETSCPENEPHRVSFTDTRARGRRLRPKQSVGRPRERITDAKARGSRLSPQQSLGRPRARKADTKARGCRISTLQSLGQPRARITQTLARGCLLATHASLWRQYVQQTSRLCLTLNTDCDISAVTHEKGIALSRLYEPWDILWSTEHEGVVSNLSKLETRRVNYFFGLQRLVKNRFYLDLWQAFASLLSEFGDEKFQPFPPTWVLPRERLQLSDYLKKHPQSKLVLKTLGGCGKFVAPREATLPPRGGAAPTRRGAPAAPGSTKKLLVVDKITDHDMFEKLPIRCLVQVYVDPFRIDGLQPVISCHVLITAVGETPRVFVHQDANVRFYNVDKIVVAHPIKTLHRLLEWFTQNGRDTAGIVATVERAIAMTVLAINPYLTREMEVKRITLNGQVCPCFQLVQLDLLLDANLRPHLLKMQHTITPRCFRAKRNLFLDTFALVSVQDLSSLDTLERFRKWILERHERKEKRRKNVEKEAVKKEKFENDKKTLTCGSKKSEEKTFLSNKISIIELEKLKSEPIRAKTKSQMGFVRKYEKPSGYGEIMRKKRELKLKSARRKLQASEQRARIEEVVLLAKNEETLWHPNHNLKEKFDFSRCMKILKKELCNERERDEAHYYQKDLINKKKLTSYRQFAINKFNRDKRKVQSLEVEIPNKNPLEKQIVWENFIEGNFRRILPQNTSELENVVRAGKEFLSFLRKNPGKTPREVKYHFMKELGDRG